MVGDDCVCISEYVGRPNESRFREASESADCAGHLEYLRGKEPSHESDDPKKGQDAQKQKIVTFADTVRQQPPVPPKTAQPTADHETPSNSNKNDGQQSVWQRLDKPKSDHSAQKKVTAREPGNAVKKAVDEHKTGSAADKARRRVTCPDCAGPHPLYKCPILVKMSLAERLLVTDHYKLCHNCMYRRHAASACPDEDCETCHVPHNSVLCPQGAEKEKRPKSKPRLDPGIKPGPSDDAPPVEKSPVVKPGEGEKVKLRTSDQPPTNFRPSEVTIPDAWRGRSPQIGGTSQGMPSSPSDSDRHEPVRKHARKSERSMKAALEHEKEQEQKLEQKLAKVSEKIKKRLSKKKHRAKEKAHKGRGKDESMVPISSPPNASIDDRDAGRGGSPSEQGSW